MSHSEYISCRRARISWLCISMLAAALVLCLQLFSSSSGRGNIDNWHRRSLHQEFLPSTTSTKGSEYGILASEPLPVDNQAALGKKPRFVLHCGPMKTGTTSLQIDLMWVMQPLLEKDGWHYVGAHDGMEQIPMDDPGLFLEMFEKVAKELRKRNMSMIHSREQYSELFWEHSWMYERLKEILSDDWDVLIVAGYRPYFEWLKSFWFQGQRLKYTDPAHPELRHENPWTHKRTGKFTLVEPMFPNYFNFWTERKRFTDSILDPASPYFPVKVYDVHDARSARTAFLCDVVGKEDVPSACKESIRLDREKPTALQNVGNSDEVQYDAIALKAAARGMVDMEKWDRTTVIDEIFMRQEEELHRSVLDFPFICPTQEYVDEFWSMSRDLDVKCMPEKSANDPNHLDNLHEKFLASVEAKKYCLVDADAVLDDPEWKEFFKKFA